MNLVFVGHVDHGKSTLIGRLLYDTDSLPEDKVAEIMRVCEEKGHDPEFAFVMDFLEEERNQGITIDTAKTFFSTEKRDYLILDAPGHVEFIKNMVTGASQADVAVLLVDLNEGVKEQTKRHAYFLSLLGISQIIVALNKIDLIDYDEEKIFEVTKELTTFLDELNIKPKHIIPISAKTGENLVTRSVNLDYDGPTFLESLDSFEEGNNNSQSDLILPIQDAYKVDDKRIYVGKIESGSLNQGDEIIIMPSLVQTKVKSIEMFNEERTQVHSGESIGFTTTEPVFIDRGNVIGLASKDYNIKQEINCNIFWITKEFTEDFIVRCATQETSAHFKPEIIINSSTLEKKEVAGKNDVLVGNLILSKEFVIDLKVPEMRRFLILKDDVVMGGGVFN